MITDIYNMKFHQKEKISPHTEVLRVPGGWIYKFYQPYNITDDKCDYRISTAFVPWNNEFQRSK